MATSSQLFGNLLADNFQGFTPSNYSNAFKTKLDSTLTSPAAQGPTPGGPGSMGGFGGQDFKTAMDAANAIPNTNARDLAIASLFGNQMRQQSDNQLLENYPKILDMIEQRQYANRLKSRPLEFQELVAKNLLKTITDLPGQVMRAGRMYDKEALEAGASLANRPRFQETIRYFA